MSNKQPALIILTPGFAASEDDSTCLPMQQDFIRCLKNKYPGLDIIILAFQYPYVINTYKWFGATIISFNGRNKGGLQKLFLRRKVAAAFEKILKEKNVVGLLSFWYGECAVVGRKIANKYGIKHYCWIFGQDARVTNHYPKHSPLRPENLIALSHFLQDEFERNHGTRPSFVIPLGMDAAQVNGTPKDIDIVGTGSLIPLKQYEIFISIVADIKVGLPAVRVILIGDGPERSKLLELIEKHKLESTITLTGKLPHSEVLQYMQRAKVLLHPSSYEGFSGVCLEAISRGAHVVSFCKAMTQDILQWHIVSTADEMKCKAVEILQSHTTFESITPYLMKDTVRMMMSLYAINAGGK